MSKYLKLVKVGKDLPAPDGRPAVIVQDFDLALDRGEFVCLIGHSGLRQVHRPVDGRRAHPVDRRVDVPGRPARSTGPGPDRGVVFQSPCLLPWMTAFENVMLGVDQVHTAPRTARSGGSSPPTT